MVWNKFPPRTWDTEAQDCTWLWLAKEKKPVSLHWVFSPALEDSLKDSIVSWCHTLCQGSVTAWGHRVTPQSHCESLGRYLRSLCLSLLCYEMGIIIVPSAGTLCNPHELSKRLTHAWHIETAQKLSIIVWGEVQSYLFSSLERLTPYHLFSLRIHIDLNS